MNLQPVRIRAARSSDAVHMAVVRRGAIRAKACGYYERSIVEAWAIDGEPERIARYGQQIADPELIVRVAEFGDDVLGFVIVDPVSSELCTIYVKPNGSGRVGHALLAEAEALAFRLTDTLTLVASLNAVRFYAENGYADEGLVNWETRDGSRTPCRKMTKRSRKEGPAVDLPIRTWQS